MPIMSTTSRVLLKHWTRLHISVDPTGYYVHAFSPRLEWFLLPLSIICIVVSLLASRKRSTKNGCILSPDASRALSVVFTPCSRGWPSHLASYFRRSRVRTASNCQSIKLDLSEVLENIFAGNIELRHAEDLSALLRGRLYVCDISITLSITRSLWFNAAKWILLQQVYTLPVCYFTSYL